MSLENFSIPELSQNPDIKSDIFSNKKNIEQGARNYVETLKAQGIEGDELNNTIKDISELLKQQNCELGECELKFLHSKETLLINYKTQLKNFNEQQNIKNKIDQIEAKHKESLAFFNHSPELIEVHNILKSEVGLELTDVLSSYSNFINEQLALPENSFISDTDYNKLINNIKTSIINQIVLLKVDLYDLKDKNDGKLKNKQWDINTAMKDRLGNITDSLLPSAIFYLNMSKDEISNQIIDKNTKGGRYNSSTYAKMRLRTIGEELVDGKINLGDDMPTGLINNDSFWTLNKVDNQRRDKFLVSSNIVIGEGETINSKIRGLKEVTFLNEKDKQIEDEAMIAILSLVACLCVPYAGAIPSAIIDIQDICSSEDQTIRYLKDMGIVDESYNMSKAWYDNVFSAIGVIGGIIGLQAAGKAFKLAKISKKIKSSSLGSKKISAIISKVTGKLGLENDDTAKLSENLPINTDQKVIDELISADKVSLYHAHKFQESAAIPRIHQQLEDIFKLNRLYGDQMDFSLDQQNIIFGSIRELINSGENFSEINLSKLSAELKNAYIPDDKIKKIIRIIEKQKNRLHISTEEVYKNAGLNKKDRIAAAIDLLDTNNLSPAQKNALIKAHEVGGTNNGVFQYTQAERNQKVRILMKEGEFTSTQTQDLLDSGLAGTRNDYMKQNSGCDNQQIMSQSLHQLGFNNLESGLLEKIGIDITQKLHVDSIKVIDGVIDNIADKVTGNLLLQILKKLPDNYIGESLEGFQIRITNRLDNLPIATNKSKKIIEGNLGDKFISLVLENKDFFISQEYIKINKEFLTQVLNINMSDCDVILDSIKIEQKSDDYTTLNLLMNRLDKIRDIAKPKTEVIEFKSVDIELLHERIRFDTTKQRISEIEKRLGASENIKLNDIQKKAIDRLIPIIEYAFEDYSVDNLSGDDIYKIINNVKGRKEILTDAEFSLNQIELLARNGIV